MPNVVERICGWARTQEQKTAIRFYDEVWTYRQLVDRVELWAARLRGAGLRRGDVVLIFLPQSPEGIAVFFGAMRCGTVPSFMPLPSEKQHPTHYWSSHARLLALTQAAALITQAPHRIEMRESGLCEHVPMMLCCEDNWPEAPPDSILPAAVDDNTVALLQHSSGTTALKKGVSLSHRAISLQVEAYAKSLRATSADVVVSWLPVYHDMGLIACTVGPLMLGQTIILLDPFKWVGEPKSLLSAISAHRATLAWLPNFAFELLAKTVKVEPGSLDLSSMRAFINCSEPAKPATFDRFLERFAAVGVSAAALQVCYAMAETVFAVTQTDLDQPVPRLTVDADLLAKDRQVAAPGAAGTPLALVSTGRAIPGMTISIVNDVGSSLPEGRVGEIELQSSFLFDGYFHRPDVTAAKLVGGRYRSGDVGFIRDGHLFVLGRVDDLIIVHGRNYFSHEVEAVANSVPGLKPGRNVAVGVFNQMIGSQDVVVIAESDRVPLEKGDLLALRRAVKDAVVEQIGLELRDVRVVAPGWLAKTTSGKISRSLNRDKYLREVESARRA